MHSIYQALPYTSFSPYQFSVELCGKTQLTSSNPAPNPLQVFEWQIATIEGISPSWDGTLPNGGGSV
ncbi:MAG: hypothetical protein AAGA10_18240 [Bacteroidota bacterium]